MESPVDLVLDALRGHGHEPRNSGPQWVSRCPAHDDRDPSLSVRTGADGRALLHCHAGCDAEAIARALGMSMSDLFAPSRMEGAPGVRAPKHMVASYDYTDEDGNLLFQKIRYEPKSFAQRRPDPARPGHWINNLDGVRRVLYGLPELLAGLDSGATVYITEGEKDAEHLRAKCNVVATTSPQGAMCNWGKEFTAPLRGASVVVIADRDGPGYECARRCRDALRAGGATVETMEAAEGKDASDHLAAGLGLADLVSIDLDAKVAAEKATTATPSPKPGIAWLSVADLTAVCDTQLTEWIAGGLLAPGSVTLLVGRPKVGKSTLTYGLVASVERGEIWCGRPTMRTPAVILSEESRRTIAEKCERYGIREARIITRRELIALSVGPISPLEAAIDHAIAEANRIGAKLIVVDTLAAWARIRDENEAAGALDATLPLQKAAEAGLAVLAIHHSRKGVENADPSDVVRGSGAIAASVDLVTVLTRTDPRSADATTRTLEILSRLEYDGPAELPLELVNGRYVAAPSCVEARDAGERRRILDAVLAAGRPMSADDVAQAAKVRKQTALGMLSRLFEDGELAASGSGRKGDPKLYGCRSQPSPPRDGNSGTESACDDAARGRADASPFPDGGNGISTGTESVRTAEPLSTGQIDGREARR